jgi:hypothetical protein
VTLLTEREAAAALRVSRSRVKQLLPRIRLSERATRYDSRDIESLVQRMKSKQPTNP